MYENVLSAEDATLFTVIYLSASAAAFFAVWMLGIRLADEKAAIHILMAAYFAHLVARTIYLSVAWKGVRDKSLR